MKTLEVLHWIMSQGSTGDCVVFCHVAFDMDKEDMRKHAKKLGKLTRTCMLCDGGGYWEIPVFKKIVVREDFTWFHFNKAAFDEFIEELATREPVTE